MNKESTEAKSYSLCRIFNRESDDVIDRFVIDSYFKDSVRKKHNTSTTYVRFTTARNARTKDIF